VIVDVHTHVMWYPDHIAEPFAREALASKLVKLRMSGGEAYSARLDLHAYDAHPEDHWAASATADRCVVFGMQAYASGVVVPNELIAEYCAQHPEKLIGWCSLDPTQSGVVQELDRCVNELGLRGLKVGPPYQGWDPTDRSFWPLFERAAELGIPTIWHQGTTFPSTARLRVAHPMLLEDLAMALPELRIIVAHLAHPWEDDLIVLMRKCPNVWTDLSAVHYRPYRYWQSMVSAMEYGVTDRIMIASDFPSGTIDNVIAGLRNVNRVAEGTAFPTIPEAIQDAIIHDNWKRCFPEWAEAWGEA
jgi:predicted TIM-barrel fold metal-dependent hydrolase